MVTLVDSTPIPILTPSSSSPSPSHLSTLSAKASSLFSSTLSLARSYPLITFGTLSACSAVTALGISSYLSHRRRLATESIITDCADMYLRIRSHISSHISAAEDSACEAAARGATAEEVEDIRRKGEEEALGDVWRSFEQIVRTYGESERRAAELLVCGMFVNPDALIETAPEGSEWARGGEMQRAWEGATRRWKLGEAVQERAGEWVEMMQEMCEP